MTKEQRIRFIFKPAVFIISLFPLGWILWLGFGGNLGANPVEAVNRFLGDWALRFLLICLAVSPVAHATNWTILARFRRMIGLYAFFYAFLHLTSYIVVDQQFDWSELWKDIVKRKFITVGMITFAILLPLAITSTNGWIKRMRLKRWKMLHRLVYVAGIGGVLHFFWMIKADFLEPSIYAVILAVLLGYRLVVRWPFSRSAEKPSRIRPRRQVAKST